MGIYILENALENSIDSLNSLPVNSPKPSHGHKQFPTSLLSLLICRYGEFVREEETLVNLRLQHRASSAQAPWRVSFFTGNEFVITIMDVIMIDRIDSNCG